MADFVEAGAPAPEGAVHRSPRHSLPANTVRDVAAGDLDRVSDDVGAVPSWPNPSKPQHHAEWSVNTAASLADAIPGSSRPHPAWTGEACWCRPLPSSPNRRRLTPERAVGTDRGGIGVARPRSRCNRRSCRPGSAGRTGRWWCRCPDRRYWPIPRTRPCRAGGPRTRAQNDGRMRRPDPRDDPDRADQAGGGPVGELALRAGGRAPQRVHGLDSARGVVSGRNPGPLECRWARRRARNPRPGREDHSDGGRRGSSPRQYEHPVLAVRLCASQSATPPLPPPAAGAPAQRPPRSCKRRVCAEANRAARPATTRRRWVACQPPQTTQPVADG